MPCFGVVFIYRLNTIFQNPSRLKQKPEISCRFFAYSMPYFLKHVFLRGLELMKVIKCLLILHVYEVFNWLRWVLDFAYVSTYMC